MFKKLTILPALAAGLALASIPAIASAGFARVPLDGRVVGPIADSDCFSLNWGSVTNVCSTAKTIEFPLTFDHGSGWLNVEVNAISPTLTSAVSCTAYTVNKGLSVRHFASRSTSDTPGFGLNKDLLMPVWRDAGGGVSVACSVQPGGRVNVINWW